MKNIIEEYTRLHNNLTKIIQDSIENVLEDYEKQSQEFYINIADRSFTMIIQKWTGHYIWDIHLQTSGIPLYSYSAKFNISEHTGKPVILQLYRNDLINACTTQDSYESRFNQ